MLRYIQNVPRYLVWAGFVLALFGLLASLSWPFGRDQGIFSWVGEVILQGGVPYRDAWEVKGPLTHYVYAFALALFGRNEISIRILDLIAVATSCLLLRRLVLREGCGRRLGANYAVLMFALTYYAWGFWETAVPEGWGGMLILATVVVLLSSSWVPATRMATAGVLIALAVLFKPSFVVSALLPVCCPAVDPLHPTGRVRLILLYAFAFVLTIGIGLVALSTAGGGLTSLATIMRFTLLFHLAQGSSASERALTVYYDLFYAGLALPLAFGLLAIGLMFRRDPGYRSVTLATWFGLSVIEVILQGRYWPHHLISTLIALSALNGIGIGECSRSTLISSAKWKAWLPIIWSSVLLQSGAGLLSGTIQWSTYALGLQTRDQYIATITGSWYLPLRRLADYVKEHSAPTDTVLMWGWDPLVNVLANRNCPTRFGYSYPLVIRSPFQTDYRRLFLKDISNALPLYIIVDAREEWALLDKTGSETLAEFPDFSRLLQSQYAVVLDVDTYQVWRRGSSARCPSRRGC